MRPAELEDMFRSLLVDGDWRVPGFLFPLIEGKTEGQIERKLCLPAAAFLCCISVPLIGQKVLHCCQQKGTEPASFLPGIAQIVLLEENRKKCLGQILGLVPIGTVATDESVNRMPIGLAQGGKRA